VNNCLWLRLDTPFPTYFYYAYDFGRVMEFYDLLQRSQFGLLLHQLTHQHNAFLHALTVALTAFVFHKSYIAILLFQNTLYFAIAIISIYLIGKKISDKFTGLLAVAIFSLYPAVYGTSRFYIIEFALMGMIPLCVLYLLRSEGFTERKYSFLFGLALGWAMMIKYSAVTFIVGPLLYVAARALFFRPKENSPGLLPVALNIGLAAFSAGIIMGIKYFNIDNLKMYLSHPVLCVRPGEQWYKLSNLRYYTLGLADQQLSMIYFFILLFSLPVFFSKEKKGTIIMLCSWIIVPWIILLTMPNGYRSAHFIIPYLPALALISASGLTTALKKAGKLKAIVIGLLLVVGACQYYDLSFGWGSYFSNRKLQTKYGEIYNYQLSENICRRPESGQAYEKIINLVSQNPDPQQNKMLVLPPTVNYSYAQTHPWFCLAWLRGLPITAIDANGEFVSRVLDELKVANFILCAGNQDIKDSAYLDYTLALVRELFRKEHDYGNLAQMDEFLKKDASLFKENFQKSISKFELVATVPYKEVSFRIYKKQR